MRNHVTQPPRPALAYQNHFTALQYMDGGLNADGSSLLVSGGLATLWNDGAYGWCSGTPGVQALDTALYRGAAGLISVNGVTAAYPGFKPNGKSLWFRAGNDSDACFIASKGKAIVTSAFATTTTALATIPGLSFDLEATKKYRFRAVLFVSADIDQGHKYSVSCSGGDPTSINFGILSIDHGSGAVVLSSYKDFNGGTAGNSTGSASSLKTVIEGTIQTNAATTLSIKFALNSTGGHESDVLMGSFLEVEEVPF